MREFAKTLGRCAALLTAAALFSLNSATAEAPVRFMSLRADGVEGRQSPNADQRVIWLYQRADLPVQVPSTTGWKAARAMKAGCEDGPW